MKTLQHPFFISCFVLWVANQLLEQSGIYIWPFYSYLDDLLCLPLSLSFILAVQRSYFHDHTVTIPSLHIVFAVVVFTLCFELMLPFFREIYTSDVLDVVAYSIGALLFHWIVNKPLAQQQAQ